MSEAILLTVIFGFIVGFVYFLVWWSYQAREDRAAKVGLYLILGAPGFLLLVAGAALSVRGHFNPLGLTLTMAAVGLLLPISPRVRTPLARLGSFSPADPLHMTGLGLFLGLLGYLGAQNILLPAPDEVASAGIASIIVQELFFVALALACVGFGIARGWRQALARLGIVRPTSAGVGAALLVVVAGFVVAVIATAVTYAIDSGTSELIDQNLETITGGHPTWIMAPIIGLSAGIAEELLFRGALQPQYGIFLTSLLFTALHGQYGFSFVLVGLFGLSVLLGLLAKRFGTTHSIIAHTIYNTVSVLLSAL